MTPPKLPHRRTVFDLLETEAPAYQAMLEELCEVAMSIARYFGEDRDVDDLLGKLDAFMRAQAALFTAIRLSRALDDLHPERTTKFRPTPIRRTRPRRLGRRHDPGDAVLERPIGTVIGEICADLATAASIVGRPPWLDTTSDALRSLLEDQPRPG